MNKQKGKASKKHFHTKKFKTSSAVKMVTEEGIAAGEVASWLGVDIITLGRWIAIAGIIRRWKVSSTLLKLNLFTLQITQLERMQEKAFLNTLKLFTIAIVCIIH